MTDAVRRVDVSGRTDSGSRGAAMASAVAILALLLAWVLFPAESAGAFHVWVVSPTFNHCFLIVPLSLFMIWTRRRMLGDASIASDWRGVAAVLGLSTVWMAAFIAGVLEAQQVAVISMVQAALFGVLGGAFYRKLAAPFLYLYFLVPSGVYLIPALQSFTASFTVAGLHVLGIPVFSNGAVIEIPAGTFAIAEACAGLRFLIASVAFGVFFAVITYRNWLRRAAFVALSIVVPIIANGFRALGLIAVAQWIGSPQAALADHIIYGWVFFSLVLVLLICFGQLFSDRHEDNAVGISTSGQFAVTSTFSARSALIATACFLAAATAPEAASFLEEPRMAALPQASPEVGQPWQRLRSPLDWRPVVVGSPRKFQEAFVNDSIKIDRFVALYDGQVHGRNHVQTGNRDADERNWTYDSARDGVLLLDGRTVPVRVSRWLRGQEHRVVWSFYVIDGLAVQNVWMAKWEQLRAYVTGNRCFSAYVALSIAGTEYENSPRAVNRLLAASQPFGPYLCQSTKAPE